MQKCPQQLCIIIFPETFNKYNENGKNPFEQNYFLLLLLSFLHTLASPSVHNVFVVIININRFPLKIVVIPESAHRPVSVRLLVEHCVASCVCLCCLCFLCLFAGFVCTVHKYTLVTGLQQDAIIIAKV